MMTTKGATMTRARSFTPELNKPRVSLAGPAVLSEQERKWVAEHEAAVHRLHPDLKAAYDAWQSNGHAGSIYDYLPNNYRQLLK